MSVSEIKPGSLVLYKIRPALVTDLGEKITITLEDSKAKRVRDKDVKLIHPGPCKDLKQLQAVSVDVEEAWELLDGEACNLADLSDLLFGEYTPDTAWSTWQMVSEGLHFEGQPDNIVSRSPEDIKADRQAIREKEQAEADKARFFENIKNASLTDDDRKKLSDVEMLALEKTDKSQILKTLDVKQTPQSAHQFLVSCGYWEKTHNPYPARMGVDLSQPEGQVPDLPEEERLDLTSMPAYAIDDDGSNDPDDAISFHNDTLWVHVADVAALVTHESELDALAAQRAANLYLPEGIVHMLPEAITSQLGLGLNEISPALSIGMHVNVDFEVDDIKIVTSFIRATRVSYSEANQQLDSLLPGVRAVTDKFRERRLANNAAEINLPEASVRVKDGKVNINLMDRLESRQLVTDAMLMAGEAVAKFCKNNEITIPFATQPAPENIENPVKMSEMFAYRRQFKASRLSLEADAHFGLGLECYTRCTSPLRRYPDLVVHQQLRAFLSHQAGEALLDRQTIEQKVMAVDQQSMTIRRTERLSNQHWKLVYLQQNPDWQGEAVVVNIDERKTTVIIPELAMETKIRTRDSFSLDDTITLRVSAVDLPEQSAFFHNLN